MRKLFVLLPILTTLFVGSVVFAQESPFGNLNEPEVKLRYYDSIEGLTLGDYLSTKENYESLEEIHERAFGTRKLELEEQILARAKDLMYAKLGAVKTQLSDVSGKAEERGLISGQAVSEINTAKDTYSSKIPGYLEATESKETVEEVIEVSAEVNSDVEDALGSLVPSLALLTVARGEEIIVDIEYKADVVQEHLNESSALGGATEKIQIEFEDAMLELEEARDDYTAIKDLVKDGAGIGSHKPTLNDIRQTLGESTRHIKKASDGLSSVVDSLRVLYGQSPWEIEEAKFMMTDDAMEEHSDSMEEEGTMDEEAEEETTEEVTE